jgi:subfamily B ATP-binding cassette protein MsbA
MAWRRVEGGSARFVAAFDALSQRSLELLSGMRTIRVFGREEDEYRRFAEASRKASRVWFQLDLLSGMVRPVSEVLVVGVVVVVLFGSLRDLAALPTVLTFAFILYRLRPHVQGIDVARAQLLAAGAPVERVMGLLEAGAAPAAARGSEPFEGLRDEIRFEEVGFRHLGATSETLERVSFRIPARRTTALLGQSGAGKSSIVHLLLRFYEPAHGEIRVDGRPLSSLELHAWRRRVTAVTQDAMLFDATVAENIAYGRPDATPEQVLRAAVMAGADGFVRALPKGYDTPVGDRGVRLSGGQKQRIALARALVREPEVLILDEATNALDAETESLVQDAIAAIGRELTLVVVSHRLSTVSRADHFVLLEDGRVTAEGERGEVPALRETVLRLYGSRSSEALDGDAHPRASAAAGE